MGKPRSFRQINTGQELQLIQDNIEKAISSAITAPILNGRLITSVNLVAGSTKIEHKLARVPQGYIQVDINNVSSIYTVSKDALFLTLSSSAAVTVSLWIF